MNKLTSSLVALFLVSSVSANVSVNVGVGAVARKTSLKIEDAAKTEVEFKKDGNKGYFAGRVNVHAFYNMFGLRVSADAGSDKKTATGYTSKSNFTARVAPAVQYNVDKFNVSASIGGVYKNVKIIKNAVAVDSNAKPPVVEASDAANAAKNHSFGLGGHVGVSYAINNKISAFVEANADYMIKRNNKFGAVDFKTKSSIDFAGCVGVSAQIIG